MVTNSNTLVFHCYNDLSTVAIEGSYAGKYKFTYSIMIVFFVIGTNLCLFCSRAEMMPESFILIILFMYKSKFHASTNKNVLFKKVYIYL